MPVNLELLRVYFSQVPDQRLSNLWHELSTEVLEWLGMSIEKLMFIINHQCPVTARYRPMILSGFLYPSPCAGTNSSCSWLSHCRNGSRLPLLNSAWPKVETHAGGQAARRFCKAPWQRCWVTGFRWRLFKVPISFRRPMGRPPLLVYWLFPDGETLQLPMVKNAADHFPIPSQELANHVRPKDCRASEKAKRSLGAASWLRSFLMGIPLASSSHG